MSRTPNQISDVHINDDVLTRMHEARAAGYPYVCIHCGVGVNELGQGEHVEGCPHPMARAVKNVRMDVTFALKVADVLAPALFKDAMRASIEPPHVQLDALTVADAAIVLAAALRGVQQGIVSPPT